MIIINSATKKTLLGTLGAAGLFVAGGQVTAHADNVKIQSGDTVSAYAQKYNVSIDDIVKANKLADANLIIAGNEINIPGVDTGSVDASTTDSSAATTTDSSAVADSTVATSDASTTSATSDAAATATTDSSATASTDTTTTSTTQADSATTNNSGNTGSTPQTAGASSNSAIALAKSLIGTPYVWGGKTPAGFDCSGFVDYVYGLSGNTTTLATLGAHQYNVTSAPEGALVFWGSDSAPYHVGISLGNGQYIAAPQEGQTVSTGSMAYYMPSFWIAM